jgi:hypothetical protein
VGKYSANSASFARRWCCKFIPQEWQKFAKNLKSLPTICYFLKNVEASSLCSVLCTSDEMPSLITAHGGLYCCMRRKLSFVQYS